LACGDKIHVAIYPPELETYSGSHALRAGPWGVYLGSAPNWSPNRIEGRTLAEAVRSAIAAYQLAQNPPNETTDPVEAVETVNEALAEPLPL
jgi:hypothetical protein